MAISVDGPVGLRNRTQMVSNLSRDQQTVIDALSSIAPSNGGKKGIWLPKPPAGSDRTCDAILAGGIWDFQTFWKRKGVFRVIDGVVDPDGHTIRKLSELAQVGPQPGPSPPGPAPGPAPDPDQQIINGFGFRQTNPAGLTQVHTISNPVIRPLTSGKFYDQFQLDTQCREFLFQIVKNGNVFWVGACVPDGTFDFTRVQVFFHPTVVNGGTVHAKDSDYPAFKGGWSGSIQRYVAMLGGQLAAARLMTMIVPFMTMASAADTAATSMWADQPVETINAIMAAVEREMSPSGVALELGVSQIGVSSFSSGVGFLRAFIRRFESSGLIKEANDFDSAYIRGSSQRPPACTGAVCRMVTQIPPPGGRPMPNWVYMPEPRWARVSAYERSVHAQIGWMTYYTMMLGSVIV